MLKKDTYNEVLNQSVAKFKVLLSQHDGCTICITYEVLQKSRLFQVQVFNKENSTIPNSSQSHLQWNHIRTFYASHTSKCCCTL